MNITVWLFELAGSIDARAKVTVKIAAANSSAVRIRPVIIGDLPET
jgi:hypothetical protein